MIGGVCINIFNISGLPPLARSCYTEAAAAVQSAVSADGPGRPCCPGEVIHDLEQVVPRARTASMDYSRLLTEKPGMQEAPCRFSTVAVPTITWRVQQSGHGSSRRAGGGHSRPALDEPLHCSRRIGSHPPYTCCCRRPLDGGTGTCRKGGRPDLIHDSAPASLLLWLRLQRGPRRRRSASG